jgi:hypothetical protein
MRTDVARAGAVGPVFDRPRVRSSITAEAEGRSKTGPTTGERIQVAEHAPWSA